MKKLNFVKVDLNVMTDSVITMKDENGETVEVHFPLLEVENLIKTRKEEIEYINRLAGI